MKRKYYVYVGQLSKDFARSSKSKSKNSNANNDKVGLYVGYSVKPPKKRWKEHLTRAKNHRGKLYSEVAAKWGEPRLHWEKFQKYNPLNSRIEAKRLEKEIAKKYRDKGYATWSDALPYLKK